MRKYLVLGLLALLTLISCRKSKFGNGDSVSDVNLSIELVADLINGKKVPLNNAKVVITHKTTNKVLDGMTDADGKIIFEGITPGTYSINAGKTVEATELTAALDTLISYSMSFNGAVDNEDVITNKELTIHLNAAKVSSWLFKQVYYAGSNTTTGAAFRDVFVEIYNNSDQVMYADSLYFAQIIGKLNNTASPYTTSGGQWDWNQSIGMAVSNANTEYIYCKSIFMIPSDGTGKRYPVEPGSSIIIAGTALNHKQPYTTNNGTPQEIVNPESTVDLSAADFEVNLVNYIQQQDPSAAPYRWDIDNPLITNVHVVYNEQQKDMVLDALGREAYVIFKSNGVNIEALPKYSTPDVREVVAASRRYVQLPINLIVDAVETQHPISSNRIPKILPNKLEAGRANVPGGQYSSQSLIRKTKQVLPNGRRILLDTDNCQNDFGHLEKADPSKGNSSFLN
jgi:hypothetical protein